jgi:hypothetical protein
MNRLLVIFFAMLIAACGAFTEEEEQALANVEQALSEDDVSAMPHFSKVLSLKQGFNFDKDKQDKVGFVTLLRLNGQELGAELPGIKDPERPWTLLHGGAVSVLSSFDWSTGSTDAMYFSGELSTENGQKMAELLQETEGELKVVFAFSIYEYEPSKKGYFRSAYADKPLQGLIDRTSSHVFRVADDPAGEVQSPQNYAFRIGIKPESQKQKVQMYVGEQRKITKIWGISERAALLP